MILSENKHALQELLFQMEENVCHVMMQIFKLLAA